jgi:hypothetical protein
LGIGKPGKKYNTFFALRNVNSVLDIYLHIFLTSRKTVGNERLDALAKRKDGIFFPF